MWAFPHLRYHYTGKPIKFNPCLYNFFGAIHGYFSAGVTPLHPVLDKHWSLSEAETQVTLMINY
jgi:hypothetical protein